MPAGRPLKFKSESKFVDYIIDNINNVVKDFYGEDIASFKRNAALGYKAFGASKPSIDILVETIAGKRIGIEVKNPRQEYHETSRSVSQLLAYAVCAEESSENLDELALITSSRHNIGTKIIKKYSLPIRVFYIDKEVHGELGI